MEDEDWLAEVFFCKNEIISVHGASPYQALIGRTPNVLKDFDRTAVPAMDDETGGEAS